MSYCEQNIILYNLTTFQMVPIALCMDAFVFLHNFIPIHTVAFKLVCCFLNVQVLHKCYLPGIQAHSVLLLDKAYFQVVC